MKYNEIETLKAINKVLESRNDYLLKLMETIRDYLLECKYDKNEVDIDLLLRKLD